MLILLVYSEESEDLSFLCVVQHTKIHIHNFDDAVVTVVLLVTNLDLQSRFWQHSVTQFLRLKIWTKEKKHNIFIERISLDI